MADQTFSDLRELCDLAIGTVSGFNGLPSAGEVIATLLRSGKDASASRVPPHIFHATRAYISRVELVLNNAQRQLEEAQNATTVLRQLREAGVYGQTLDRLVQAEAKWREVVQTRRTLSAQLYFLHQVQMQESLIQVVVPIESTANLSMAARGMLSRLGTASDIIRNYHENWQAFEATSSTQMWPEASPSTTVAYHVPFTQDQQTLQTQQHQQVSQSRQHQLTQMYQYTQPQQVMQTQQFQQTHHGSDSAQRSLQAHPPTQWQSQYLQSTAGPSNYRPSPVQNGQYHQAAVYSAPQLQNGSTPIVSHNGSPSQFGLPQPTSHLSSSSTVNGYTPASSTSHVGPPQAPAAQAQASGSMYLAPTREPPPSGAQASYPAASTITRNIPNGVFDMRSVAPVNSMSQASPMEGRRVQQAQQGASTLQSMQPTRNPFRQQAQQQPSGHLQPAAVQHSDQEAQSVVPSPQAGHATQESLPRISGDIYQRPPTTLQPPATEQLHTTSPSTAASATSAGRSTPLTDYHGQGQPSTEVQLTVEPSRAATQSSNLTLQPSSLGYQPPAAIVASSVTAPPAGPPPVGLLRGAQARKTFTVYRTQYAARFHSIDNAAAAANSTVGPSTNHRTNPSQMYVPAQWQQQVQAAADAAGTRRYQPGWLPRAPPAPIGPLTGRQAQQPHRHGQHSISQLASRPPDLRGGQPPVLTGHAVHSTAYPSIPPTATRGRVSTSTENAGPHRLLVQPDRKRVARDILRALQGSAAVKDAVAPQSQGPAQGLGKRKRSYADPPARPLSAQAGPSSGQAGPSSSMASKPLATVSPAEIVAVSDGPAIAVEPRAVLLQAPPLSSRATPESPTTPPARIPEEPADIELSTDVLRSPEIPTLRGVVNHPVLLNGLQGGELFASVDGSTEAMRMDTVVHFPPPAAPGTSRNTVPLFWDDSTPSPAGVVRTGRRSPSVGSESAASEADVAAMLDGPNRSDTAEAEAQLPPSGVPHPIIIDVDLLDDAGFDTIPLQDMSPVRPVKSGTRYMPAVPLVREQPVASGSSLRSIPPAFRGQSASSTLQRKQLAILRPPPPVKHQWSLSKPDRLIVELPRLPAGWGNKAPPPIQGYGDFAQRIRQCPCRWEGCPAVLGCEDRLSMHMRKVHGNTLPADGHCQWSGCTRKFRQLAGLQSHLEQAHARSDLHCAYQDCEFHSVSSAALAKHIGDCHSRDAILPLAEPQQPVASILPSLPTETEIPSWSLATPIVRAAPMHAQRNLQLGNWVLANVFAKVDLDEVLPIAKRVRGRPRGDRAMEEEQLVTEPLVRGVALDHKQQFNWVDGEQTRKPRALPSLTVK